MTSHFTVSWEEGVLVAERVCMRARACAGGGLSEWALSFEGSEWAAVHAHHVPGRGVNSVAADEVFEDRRLICCPDTIPISNAFRPLGQTRMPSLFMWP